MTSSYIGLQRPQVSNTPGNIVDNPLALAAAWVRFNGVAGAVIDQSYNVSSVTFNATGDYIVNFTNAIGTETPAVVAMSGQVSTRMGNTTSSAAVVQTLDSSSVLADSAFISVAVFGGPIP